MSIVQIKITEQHLILLKNIHWSIEDGFIISKLDDASVAPFGGDSLYEGMDIILNGINEKSIDINNEDPIEYSDQQKLEWDKLYAELPYVLEILLSNLQVELGIYRAKYHDRVWKKVS